MIYNNFQLYMDKGNLMNKKYVYVVMIMLFVTGPNLWGYTRNQVRNLYDIDVVSKNTWDVYSRVVLDAVAIQKNKNDDIVKVDFIGALDPNFRGDKYLKSNFLFSGFGYFPLSTFFYFLIFEMI